MNCGSKETEKEQDPNTGLGNGFMRKGSPVITGRWYVWKQLHSDVMFAGRMLEKSIGSFVVCVCGGKVLVCACTCIV